ncbi:MAG: hypothetical protein MZV49_09145, partial [Rhodopseudomonas palustris]|nr:hypothetical protein [Rhodopseudomonas palustris]
DGQVFMDGTHGSVREPVASEFPRRTDRSLIPAIWISRKFWETIMVIAPMEANCLASKKFRYDGYAKVPSKPKSNTPANAAFKLYQVITASTQNTGEYDWMVPRKTYLHRRTVEYISTIRKQRAD